MNLIKRTIGQLEVFYMPSKKFKTIDVAFVFTNELNPQEINERNFLTEILLEASKNYNSPEKMSLACDNLYGLDKNCSYHTVGNMGITTFMIRSLNDKYLDEDNIFSQSFDLLLEMIYNPKMYKGLIPKRSVFELIEQTEELLLSIKQNKNAYTYYQFMKEYTRNNQDRIGIFPEMRYFDMITHETVTKTYQKMVTEDKLQVFIAGDFDHQDMDDLLTRKLSHLPSSHEISFDFKSEFVAGNKTNEIIEKNSTGQTRIFVGYNLNLDLTKEHALILTLFDELFGSYEKSKLFANIREKLHLSYYVYSRYNEDNNLFFVGLETNKQNRELALKEVDNQLKACQNGEIDDELFDQAKQNLIKRLDISLDSQTKLLLHNIIGFLRYEKSFDLEKRKQEIVDIKKAELIELIQKITIDTIYVYTNED